MTRATYNAFIDKAKAQGTDPLPDSQQLSNQNDQTWTYTHLTGEPADATDALIAEVDSGQVDQYWHGRDNDRPGLRFRPAVEI